MIHPRMMRGQPSRKKRKCTSCKRVKSVETQYLRRWTYGGAVEYAAVCTDCYLQQRRETYIRSVAQGPKAYVSRYAVHQGIAPSRVLICSTPMAHRSFTT